MLRYMRYDGMRRTFHVLYNSKHLLEYFLAPTTPAIPLYSQAAPELARPHTTKVFSSEFPMGLF